MIAVALCAMAFAIALMAGWRSLGAGLAVTLAVGYVYGIMRANILETAIYFMFDAAVLGLYISQFSCLWVVDADSQKRLQSWVLPLIAWPAVLFCIPIQDTLIQLVGLRGNALFLPFLLFGARLEGAERYRLALWIAALNLGAFAVASAEYVLGLERFFPQNYLTETIYRSRDVAGFTEFRIPASFTGAHAYATTMVLSMPLIAGAWHQVHRRAWQRHLLFAALVASLLGVFMAATRLHFIVACLVAIVMIFSSQSKPMHRLGWLLILGLVSWVVFSDERLQRFTTLGETDTMADRIAASVNMGFFDVLAEYPLGNGLGGGGTSIPYFWQHLIRNPVWLENEYTRILMEEGAVGLTMWCLFLLWVFGRRGLSGGSWKLGRQLAWVCAFAYFGTGLVGVGLLTSMPATCLLLLNTGWIAVDEPGQVDRAAAATSPSGARSAGRTLPWRGAIDRQV